jgi:hypothetical protein
MSQASKALKEIAAGPEYTLLAQAVEKSDYEAIAAAYRTLAVAIEEKKRAVLEKIDTVPGQMGENRQQFITAFNSRLDTLPAYEKLFKMINEQKIVDGDITDVGSKGDPIVKTADGKTVIISGAKAEKGAHIKYKIITEGQKLDFGKFVELNADFFYSVLNQETLNKIELCFNSVENRLRSGEKMTPEILNEMLAALEQARGIACSLKSVEQERTSQRILAYRKKMLGDYGMKLAFDFMAAAEEKEIRDLYPGDEVKTAKALAAPGLFRRQQYMAFKNSLFMGAKLKGSDEIQAKLEKNIESMDSALKLMEFKATLDELESNARGFVAKMDELFDKLNNKARYTVYAIAEDKTFNAGEIQGKIEGAFSGISLFSEIRRIFRGQGDYFSSREAAVKLKTTLGDAEIQSQDSAIRPYLRNKMGQIYVRKQ